MKQLTQGQRGKTKAAFKYENQRTFYETFVLFLDTNRLPAISDDVDDAAFWDRLPVIHFPTKFPKDHALFDILLGEAEGVLAWLVEGAVEWYQSSQAGESGLKPPPEVIAQTEAWRKECDVVGRFVHDCGIVADPKAKVGAYSVYETYCDWAKRHRERSPWSEKRFGTALKKRFTRFEANGHFYYRLRISGAPPEDPVDDVDGSAAKVSNRGSKKRNRRPRPR